MKPYAVLVQAGPEEILHAGGPDDLNLVQLQNWPQIAQVMVVLPDLQGVEGAVRKLDQWKFRSFVGDAYNVCKRVIDAQALLNDESFSVRVLAIWKHLDLAFVDQMVAQMRRGGRDAVLAPRDFDVTFAADIASLASLRKISELPGDSQQEVRARFNPWGYMDMKPESFNVLYAEPAPVYDDRKVSEILKSQRCDPENEFFGRDYAGSRYHFLEPMIPDGLRILDMACGSGSGSHLLSKNAEFVLGVDYLDAYVDQARERYAENERLHFCRGDGQSFLPAEGPATFDLAISLHTLEHVPDDTQMLKNINQNLKRGGRLIVEVPLLMPRPLGRPVNPYHLREYQKEAFMEMVRAAGFTIERSFAVCRSFYGEEDLARDAIQLHAVKK